MNRASVVVVLGAALAATGCLEIRRVTTSSRRAFAELTRDTAVAQLEKSDPAAAARLAKSAGWAAFGDGAGAAFDVESGVGFGVAHDNASGRDTFMTMAVRETAPLRVVVVFADAGRFQAFRAQGGTLELPPPPGVEVFCFQDGALAPPDDLRGATFKPDADMNSK